jgi:glucokinase
MMILAGDIGGTKSYLELFEIEDGKLRPIGEIKKFFNKNYCSFTALLEDFLSSVDEKSISVACFGIAGPIKTDDNGICFVNMTNINSWPVISEDELSKLFLNVKILLINDLGAMAYGVSQVSEDDLVELNAGNPKEGNRAVIAAGTGLGEVLLYWNGHEHVPVASEGGHTDFAARDKLESELLNYLRKKYYPQLINYEKILSGQGLVNIYEFLRDSGEYGEETVEFGKQDPAQVISDAALANEDPLCSKALEVFVSMYGAQARNLALQCLPINGLYIGGGIAPKILPKLRDTTFMQAFANQNGDFPDLLASIPVKVIMNPQVGLLGAAWCAAIA